MAIQHQKRGPRKLQFKISLRFALFTSTQVRPFKLPRIFSLLCHIIFNTVVVFLYRHKPSALFHQDHRDWAPTKLMGHISTFFASASTVNRFDRTKIGAEKVRQKEQRLEEQQALTEVFDNKENDCTTIKNNVVSNNHGVSTLKIQLKFKLIQLLPTLSHHQYETT